MPLLSLLGLFAVGVVSGLINVVAGGGSFLTLPILIFMGLSPTVANGTNRVGILLQSVAGAWGFHRHKVLDGRFAAWAAVPATAGAVIGTWAALLVGDEAFRRILAGLMVAITLLTILRPPPASAGRGGGSAPPAPPLARVRLAALAAGFFLVGIYGGFVQAGVGFLILAATTMAGLDLVRGNAVKVVSILAFTTVSLLIFAASGRVDWWLGLVLAAGSVVGARLGVRLTVLKGHRFVRGAVTVAVLVFAAKLWLDS